MKVPEPIQLNSGAWRIQLRLGADKKLGLKGESVSIVADSRKECIRQAQLIKAEYKAGKRTAHSADGNTLGTVLDMYIASKEKTLSPSTVRAYKSIRNNHFSGYMDLPIKKITDWQAVFDAESDAGASYKTVKNAVGLIRAALNKYDINCGELTKVTINGKKTAGERPFLEPEQIPIFLKAIEDKPCELSALLALHSLRISEILALEWDQVDLEKRQIIVSGAVVPDENNKRVRKDENKTAASKRIVPIMIPRLLTVLENAPERTGTVVTAAPNSIFKQINRCCESAQLPQVGNHGLRHTFASLAYHLNMPEMIAMKIGGWSDSSTMHRIYTHLAESDLLKWQNAMASFYENLQ